MEFYLNFKEFSGNFIQHLGSHLNVYILNSILPFTIESGSKDTAPQGAHITVFVHLHKLSLLGIFVQK